MCRLILGLVISTIVMIHVSPRRRVPGISFWNAVGREVDSSAVWGDPGSPRDEGQGKATPKLHSQESKKSWQIRWSVQGEGGIAGDSPSGVCIPVVWPTPGVVLVGLFSAAWLSTDLEGS